MKQIEKQLKRRETMRLGKGNKQPVNNHTERKMQEIQEMIDEMNVGPGIKLDEMLNVYRKKFHVDR